MTKEEQNEHSDKPPIHSYTQYNLQHRPPRVIHTQHIMTFIYAAASRVFRASMLRLYMCIYVVLLRTHHSTKAFPLNEHTHTKSIIAGAFTTATKKNALFETLIVIIAYTQCI